MDDYQKQILPQYAATWPQDKGYFLIKHGNRACGLKNKKMQAKKKELGIISLED